MESGSEVALRITPKSSSVNANGIYRHFAVTAGDEFETQMKIIAVDGGSFDFGVTLKFKKANGTVVKMKSVVKTIKKEHVLALSAIVPSGATQVQVSVGANDPSDGTVLAFVPWWVGTADAPTGGGECGAPECPACDISCTTGTHLVSECLQDTNCNTFSECYCEDDDDGETGLMQGSNWSDW